MWFCIGSKKTRYPKIWIFEFSDQITGYLNTISTFLLRKIPEMVLLSAQLIYRCTIFKFPKYILKQLTSLLLKFYWKLVHGALANRGNLRTYGIRYSHFQGLWIGNAHMESFELRNPRKKIKGVHCCNMVKKSVLVLYAKRSSWRTICGGVHSHIMEHMDIHEQNSF